MKFVANGVKYEFDDQKMTFAEARTFEKTTGRTMAELGRGGTDDITSVQAMIWIAMKRENPSLRFTDLDDMPIGDIEWIREDDEEPDPPEPGGDPGEDSTPTG